MRLHHDAREYYRLEIITDPVVAAWEASFDDGDSWHASTSIDGLPAWLVAGPDAEQGTAVAVITSRALPLIRATDNPEIIVRRAPSVIVD